MSGKNYREKNMIKMCIMIFKKGDKLSDVNDDINKIHKYIAEIINKLKPFEWTKYTTR